MRAHASQGAAIGASGESVRGVSTFAAYLVAFVVFVNITRVASIYGFMEAMEIPLLSTAFAGIVMFSQANTTLGEVAAYIDQQFIISQLPIEM